jgi:hypothetical protein
MNEIIQKVETIKNIDGSIKHMAACYHPRIECGDRKTYKIGGIAISTYCPYLECKIRKD